LGLALAALPGLTLAVTLVDWLVTVLVAPRILPKLDFHRAIAADCPTAIAIPVLVGGEADVAALERRLEAHRLANPDPMLRFVLLSDLSDAAAETTDADAAAEAALSTAIGRLNARCRRALPPAASPAPLQRPRGGLDGVGAQARQAGAVQRPDPGRAGRAVLADRRGPRGAAARALRGDGGRRHRAAAGFGQPHGRRPRPSAERGAGRCGDAAIDIYSRGVSDVHQDLLGAGTFTGRGL
jgi:cyclic beta-1,2-glucan synthetase